MSSVYPVFTSLGIMSPDPRFCFIWIWRLLFSKVIAHGRSEEISILIDVVEFFDLVFVFVLIRVKVPMYLTDTELKCIRQSGFLLLSSRRMPQYVCRSRMTTRAGSTTLHRMALMIR